jgi:hypothetical protein
MVRLRSCPMRVNINPASQYGAFVMPDPQLKGTYLFQRACRK